MKVEERVIEKVGVIDGERIRMEIDNNAMQHIQSILIDLYKDPEMAVLREYSTNALDAHVEAGVTRPIEVTLPSSLSPYLKIRDYGEGLDVEDIRNIYSKYGASTKRESNDAVGMLGLGCKSGLTYTDSFTLTGIKNGICTHVEISRDEDGGGTMSVPEPYETDKPSGVEITISAERYNNFAEKAANFFRFWKEGTVLVNGQEPKKIQGLQIADDLLLTTETEENIVVMGNVAYPMGDGENNWGERHSIVAFVDIGEVHFTPAREALNPTKKTKAAIEIIKQRVKDEFKKAVQRLIDDAKDHCEALKVWLEATKATNINYSRTSGPNAFNAVYKGDKIIETAESPTKKVARKKAIVGQPGKYEPMKDQNGMIIYDNVAVHDEQFVIVSSHKGWGAKGWERNPRFIATQFEKTIWFEGYTGEDFTPYKRKKLMQWLTENNIDIGGYSNRNYYVFCKKIPKSTRKWLDASTIYDWETTVKAIKIARENVKRKNGRPTGSYKGTVAQKCNNEILADQIDTSKSIFWYTSRDSINYADDAVWTKHSDCTIIKLEKNRVAKFQRDFPQAKNLFNAAEEIAADWRENLSEDDVVALYMNVQNYAKDFKVYDENEINDPDFKEAIVFSKIDMISQKRKWNIFRYFGIQLLAEGKLWNNPMDKYPLLTLRNYYGTMNKEFKNHVYTYVNAVYALEQISERGVNTDG